MSDLAARIAEPFAGLATEIGFAATHLETGASLAINADALFPTASVFKVPVMVEVFRQADEGRFAMADRIPMAAAQRSVGSGVMQRLGEGVALSVRDLAMLMIIISDNTATQMLLDLVGPDAVTATMRLLGLANINVRMTLPQLFAHAYNLPLDPLPDFEALQRLTRNAPIDYGSLAFAASPDNTTSNAADMARLLGMIFRKQAGRAAACDDMLTILRAQQLRDRVPRYLPVGGVGNKTGTLRGVRNDAGLMMRGAGDTIAFALFTFDRTQIAPDDARGLAGRNVLVNDAMAEVGALLWDEFRP
ncbi:MAG TPA: serine hydrolase [Acetobacteraceae bacterium]|jgi:beta-lactamase class A|nr:serine hydrolase [Acetobacteraceae bacterium]